MDFSQALSDIEANLGPTLADLDLDMDAKVSGRCLSVSFVTSDRRWISPVTFYLEPTSELEEQELWNTCRVHVEDFRFERIGNSGWKRVGVDDDGFDIKPRSGPAAAVLATIRNRIIKSRMLPLGDDLPFTYNTYLADAYNAVKRVLPRRIVKIERRVGSESETVEGMSFLDADGAQMWLAVDDVYDDYAMARLYRDGVEVEKVKAHDEMEIEFMIEDTCLSERARNSRW